MKKNDHKTHPENNNRKDKKNQLKKTPTDRLSADVTDDSIAGEEIPGINDDFYNDQETGYEKMNQKDIVTGRELDVPGSELDDAMEDTGSEDEENNYYSLGGDNHKDLEDNK